MPPRRLLAKMKQGQRRRKGVACRDSLRRWRLTLGFTFVSPFSSPLPYEIWRAAGGWGRLYRARVRQERVLARITARVITPGSSGGRGVTFNRFDALHGPENEAVDATRSSALPAFAINLPEFAQILHCLNVAFPGFGLPRVKFEVKQIRGREKGWFDFSSERTRTADGACDKSPLARKMSADNRPLSLRPISDSRRVSK